jgi:hypothetical protein
MAIFSIQDRLCSLKGNDLLSLTVRKAAIENRSKDAMHLVTECFIDNERMAFEVFGEELVKDILKWVLSRKNRKEAEKKPETVSNEYLKEQLNWPDDLPEGVFHSPGIGMGDN